MNRKRMLRIRWIGLLATTMAVAANAAAPGVRCDATCLRKLADRYVANLVKKDAKKLPLDRYVKITENGKVIRMNEGLWKGANRLEAFQEYFVDATSGHALFVGVVRENDTPVIVATRLRAPYGEIIEIETIVARKGSHPLFTPELMTEADPLFAKQVPIDERVPRTRLIAIANLYFDGIEKNSSADIPAVANCDRFENGTKTTFRTPTSGNCAKSADAINYIKAVKDRRYFMVDEATGVVACTIVFDIPGGDPVPQAASSGSEGQLQTTLRQPRMLLLTELFKIEGGNIVRIQAVMHNLPHGSGSSWEEK